VEKKGRGNLIDYHLSGRGKMSGKGGNLQSTGEREIRWGERAPHAGEKKKSLRCGSRRKRREGIFNAARKGRALESDREGGRECAFDRRRGGKKS